MYNIADPSESGDGINWKFLKNSIRERTKTISGLKDEMDNLNKDLKKHRSEIDENFISLGLRIRVL